MNGVLLSNLYSYGAPLGIALGGLLVGLVLQRFLLPYIRRLAEQSAWKFDDALVDAIQWPIVLWFFLLGARIAVRVLPLRQDVDATLGTVLLVLGILSVTWAAARFAALVVRASVAQGGLTGASLLSAIARVVIGLIGLLVVLQTLGIRIGPVLAALGVGGLAVGLALQDTLANIFAGIRILAARKIRPGDYIRLESGQDGWVADIAWGTTTIRQGLGNMVIVPNQKLAQQITVNYSLPALEQLFVTTIVVAHGSDLDAVERAAKEEARATLQALPQGIKDFDPPVLFQPFSDSGIPFIVVMKATAFTDTGALTSAFLKRLHARFRADHIELGFPSRRLYSEPGGAISRAAPPPEPGGTSPARAPSR